MQNSVGKSLYARPKPSYLNLILNIIIVLFFIAFISEIVFNLVFTNIYVKGRSMMPTLIGAPMTDETSVLPGGDYVFVNTRATPDYFDIVVVQTETVNASGKSSKYDIIKRVVAFGGDTVKMEGGKLFIKYAGDSEFTEIEESYVSPENNDKDLPLNTFAEHEVQSGCMFLLGDNRNVSEDSRNKGDFAISALVGVVPQWSLKYKSEITAIYTFFEFTLRSNMRLGISF